MNGIEEILHKFLLENDVDIHLQILEFDGVRKLHTFSYLNDV